MFHHLDCELKSWRLYTEVYLPTVCGLTQLHVLTAHN